MELSTDEAEFLSSHQWAVFSTGRRDGSPQASLIGYCWDGDDILLTFRRSSAKYHNVVRQPRVVMVVPDGRAAITVYGDGELVERDPERVAAYAAIVTSFGAPEAPRDEMVSQPRCRGPHHPARPPDHRVPERAEAGASCSPAASRPISHGPPSSSLACGRDQFPRASSCRSGSTFPGSPARCCSSGTATTKRTNTSSAPSVPSARSIPRPSPMRRPGSRPRSPGTCDAFGRHMEATGSSPAAIHAALDVRRRGMEASTQEDAAAAGRAWAAEQERP